MPNQQADNLIISDLAAAIERAGNHSYFDTYTQPSDITRNSMMITTDRKTKQQVVKDMVHTSHRVSLGW
jgi:hypothetical protein